jgi:Flp pilus assembly secretin CpaC
MSVFLRIRPVLLPVLSAAIVMAPALCRAEDKADQISVVVDQAKLVRLPEKIATLVIGNPLIADVALQPGNMMIVTGKGYGATNVIALDRDGRVLADRMIQVEGPSENLVTVYRGVERESYSCTPICQRRVTLGDATPYFSSNLEQAGSFSNTASGNAMTSAANSQAAASSSSSGR